jgi:hypothetical protein
MLTNAIKETVQQLEPFDKALLIEYLIEHLQTSENNEIVQAWTLESQNRLEAVKAGKLDLIEYNELKRRIT